MNARQKCKQLKKQLTALYEDYVASAIRCGELMDRVSERIDKFEESKVTCVESMTCAFQPPMDDSTAKVMIEKLTNNEGFLRAVVFEGHTDPDTGKYILEAKLTVVMPELSEQSEDGFENEVENDCDEQ